MLGTWQSPVHSLLRCRCEHLTPQLFHRLRFARHGAQRDPVVEVDHGHSDNLRLVNADEDLHHHVLYLRRKNIESRQRGDSNNGQLHGTPQNPLLLPDLGEPVRPGAPDGKHIIHVHWIAQGACRLERSDASETWPCSASRDPPPRPLPFSDLVRCGAETWQGPSRRSSVRGARTA